MAIRKLFLLSILSFLLSCNSQGSTNPILPPADKYGELRIKNETGVSWQQKISHNRNQVTSFHYNFNVGTAAFTLTTLQNNDSTVYTKIKVDTIVNGQTYEDYSYNYNQTVYPNYIGGSASHYGYFSIGTDIIIQENKKYTLVFMANDSIKQICENP